MLTQQPCCSAVVPRHCEVVWHSLRALICRPQLALSQPGSRQVLWVCVVSCMGCAVKVRKKKLGSEKTPPLRRNIRGSGFAVVRPSPIQNTAIQLYSYTALYTVYMLYILHHPSGLTTVRTTRPNAGTGST